MDAQKSTNNKDMPFIDPACRRCFEQSCGIEDLPEDCPVVAAVHTELNSSLAKPNKTAQATLQLLQIATHEEFRSTVVSERLFTGDDRHLSETTRAQRFAKAVVTIKKIIGDRGLVSDTTVNPHTHLLDNDVLEIWCMQQPRIVPLATELESESETQEPMENPFKHVTELPGLSQLVYNVIMSDISDPEENKNILDAIVENIQEARAETRRPILVADAIKDAKTRCLNTANIKRYGKNPRAAERFARLSLIEERLRG